jgi:hypothetical protein
VSVDDGAPTEVSAGRALTLDTQAHSLVFSCRKLSKEYSVCDESRMTIAAGVLAEPIDVRLHIRDAILRVDGDPKRRYDIPDNINVHVIVGGDTVIPMTSGAVWITVVERGETDRSQRVQVFAGRPVSLSFL